MAEGFGGTSSGSSGAAYSGGGGGSLGSGSSGASYSGGSSGYYGGYGGSYGDYSSSGGYQSSPYQDLYQGYVDPRALNYDPAQDPFDVKGAADNYRSLPANAPDEVREAALQAYQDSFLNHQALDEEIKQEKLPTEQDPGLEKYRNFLRDNFIDPNSIGTARLYTDPVTGQRKMDVPSIRQEEAAAHDLEMDKKYVNALKRREMEAARGPGSPVPSSERMRAEAELAASMGPTYNASVDEQRKRFLNAALASGGYKPIRKLGIQTQQQPTFTYDPSTEKYIPIQQQQPLYQSPNSIASSRYGGPQKSNSNGYQ